VAASAGASLAENPNDLPFTLLYLFDRAGAATLAIRVTWLRIVTPSAARNWRATAPAATRAAVSRALARSSTLRASSKPYFCRPARSAWPGRGRCTCATPSPLSQGPIRSTQFS